MVESGAEGIFGWSGVDGNHLGAELGHAWGDVVLRNDCEEQHCDYGKRGWLREYFWRKREAEGGYEIETASDDAEVMETSEGDADDGAGLVTALKCGEERGGDGEAEVDDRAEPGAERKELDEAQNVGHPRKTITGF